MTLIQIAALYAAVNALIVLVLVLNVVRHRRRAGISLGTGGDGLLERAVRAHGNTIEYVPLVLILMLAAALLSSPAWALHAAGLMLAAGRILHAIGLMQTGGASVPRAAGTLLTWAALLLAAGLCLGAAFA